MWISSTPRFLLEQNDGAGNTFKATAKPVLIGTAVVGATTLIFSIIMLLTHGLTDAGAIAKLSILYAPFLIGLIMGGAEIYWFTGASMQAVVTGAFRAVAFIKRNMKLEGAAKASMEDSKKVVEICTRYAQAGMINIFLTVFFSTLAYACLEPYFFIGYLISMATFGLFQAIFMANAGGAWDNAKKIVEVELRQKGTALHAATVVGDTVGDPFKDTSSVAMNPIIKFTTLFGLLAVEMATSLVEHDSRLLAVGGVFPGGAGDSFTGRFTECGSAAGQPRPIKRRWQRRRRCSGGVSRLHKARTAIHPCGFSPASIIGRVRCDFVVCTISELNRVRRCTMRLKKQKQDPEDHAVREEVVEFIAGGLAVTGGPAAQGPRGCRRNADRCHGGELHAGPGAMGFALQ